MENFNEELKLMVGKNAIIQVGSYEELGDCLTKLLNDDSHRLSLQTNTKDLIHNAEATLDSYTTLILNQKSQR
jgi:3-deoxy-D-manno-octulosonic-acid transferase